jgi:hypothetical protein
VTLKRAKLGFDDEEIVEVQKDHFSIARFKHPNDALLLRIVQYIQDFIDTRSANLHPDFFHLPGTAYIDIGTIQRTHNTLARIYHRLPLANSEIFVGQDQYMKKLHDYMIGPCPDKHVTIWGQRGIGKTEAVLHYATVHKHEYNTAIWFDASNESALRTTMEDFYDYLAATADPSLLEMAENNQSKKCETVLEWFTSQGPCLVVYDNVDMDDGFKLRKYFPPTSNVRRIIIGRNQKACEQANFDIEMTPMIKEDALNMFIKLAKLSKDTLTGNMYELEDVVKELDYTPFYISLAAQYCLTVQLGSHQLLGRIKKQKDYMERNPLHIITDGSAIWFMAHKKIAEIPDSYMLLRLFAFLYGFDIGSIL